MNRSLRSHKDHRGSISCRPGEGSGGLVWVGDSEGTGADKCSEEQKAFWYQNMQAFAIDLGMSDSVRVVGLTSNFPLSLSLSLESG